MSDTPEDEILTQEDSDAVSALFMAHKEARLRGDIGKAKSSLEDILAILSRYKSSDIPKLKSRYAYEYGFFLNILGEYAASISQFEQSGNFARAKNDELRGLVGDFRATLTAYNSGYVDAAHAKSSFMNVQRSYDALRDVPEQDERFLLGNKFNVAKRVHETAFELNSADFEVVTAMLKDHPLMREALTEFEPAYELMFAQLKARSAMFESRHKDAAITISTYLGVDVPGLGHDEEIRKLKRVIKFVNEGAEEISKDYRDLGRALLAMETAEYCDAAINAWKRGLEIHPGRGNLRFLGDIIKDMDALKKTSP